jgi:hypothetical protein
MTSAAARRVAKVEGALQPREAVLAWLADAQQFPTIEDQARSIADLPVEAAPLSVISARVVTAVRETMKGRPRDDVERAARQAEGDAVFLFSLVLRLNREVFEVTQMEGLRATATFLWMGVLLGGPHEPPATEEDARERDAAWWSWRGLVDRLASDARVATEARQSLQERYFGGHDVLFVDAAQAWAGHVEQVERLARMAEMVGSAEPAARARGIPRPRANAAVDERVEAVARHLADDARVRAYEVLGDRERAVSIMERRLEA